MSAAMDVFFGEWINLLLRWVHMIVASSSKKRLHFSESAITTSDARNTRKIKYFIHGLQDA